MPGLAENTVTSTRASAGVRSATKRLKPSAMAAGSCPGTRRNETLAEASAAITVLAPAPV